MLVYIFQFIQPCALFKFKWRAHRTQPLTVGGWFWAYNYLRALH